VTFFRAGIPRYNLNVCDCMACPSSLAPPAVTRFPFSIMTAVIVAPHRGQFRRAPSMRNTCSKWLSRSWWR